MSVGGLCQICQSAQAETQCDRCGDLVCRDHFDREATVCVECSAELGDVGGRPGRRDEGSGDPDVDHYTF